MIYQEYMNRLTVSDEVKSTLYRRMKNYQNQLEMVGQKEKTNEPKPEKKNTFKKHPKRWTAIIVAGALVAASVVPIVYYTLPGRTPGGTPLPTLSLGYMKNLMVDVDGVTAYSLKKNTDSGQNTGAVKKSKSISLLSAPLSDEKETRADDSAARPGYYLYSTNVTYESGNVEYDTNGIQKVTFKKNTEVKEEVYDDKGELIDSSREINQDELDAQITKMFTTKNYTYLQYVAMVEEDEYYYEDEEGNLRSERVRLRPEDGMTYDENGVADFDKRDYFSGRLNAAFVIDNETGYIYKIENFYIVGFYNGFVMDDTGNYYSVGTDAEHNLLFTAVLPNQDAEIYNVVQDNYGWTYVVNDIVNEVDTERKIMYVTENIGRSDFAFDKDHNVYKINSDYGGHASLSEMVDGQAVPLEKTVVRGLVSLYGDMAVLSGAYHNLTVANFNFSTSKGLLGAYCYGFETDEKEMSSGLAVINSRYGLYWLDSDYDTIIARSGDKLSYATVDLDECLDKIITLNADSDFTLLSEETLYRAEEYYMPVGEDRYKVKDVYYHAVANKTSYYRIVKTERGVELEELTSKSYTDNVFIFQPINK